MDYNDYTDYVDCSEQKKNKRGKPSNVITVVICVLLSAAMGFLGGYVANQSNKTIILGGTDQPQATSSPTPKPSFDGSIFTQGQASGDDPLTIAQVAAQVSDTVVEITTETVVNGNRLQQYIATGAGSGVIFRSDGYIVTNNHVIDSASKITVTMSDGTSYDASLIGTDEQTDIAVIKIEASGLNAAVFGDSSQLIVGQTAIAIGNPLGSLGGTVTNGIISALDREITIDDQTMTLLQTNAAVNPGNSGGGLFDANGLLIGVVNAKSSGSDVEGLGFAIPIDTVKGVITDLVQYGYVRGRVYTGMSMIEITDSITALQYRVSYYGVYVYSIDGDSNAYAAGIRTGDYIKSVNGSQISTLSEFNRMIRSLSIGDTVEITVIRSKQTHTYSFTLQEYTVKGFEQ